MIVWPQTPTNKKYTLKYEQLIKSRQNRILSEGTYYETHHIVPRSLGGKDEKSNLIRLTAREHYIAHAFLYKMQFPKKYHAKMAYAFCTFIYGFKKNKHKESYKFSSKMYEAFKKNLSNFLSEYQQGENNGFYGRHHSQETKVKLSTYRKGKKLEDIFSPEAIEKIRYNNKNRVLTPKQKAIIKEAQKKYWANKKNREKVSKRSSTNWADPSYRKKMTPFIEARRGVARDPKIIEKGIISKRKKVEAGIPWYTEEALHNIREAAKNRKYTEEHIENIRKANRIKFKNKKQTSEQIRKRVESRRKTMAAKRAAGWRRKGKPLSKDSIEKMKSTLAAKRAKGWNPKRNKSNPK